MHFFLDLYGIFKTTLIYNFIANLKGEYKFDVTTQITVATLNRFSKTVMWSIFSTFKVTLVPN